MIRTWCQFETPPGCRTSLQVHASDAGVDSYTHDCIVFCILRLLATTASFSVLFFISSSVKIDSGWEMSVLTADTRSGVYQSPFRSAGNYTHPTKVHTELTLTANYHTLCSFHHPRSAVVTVATGFGWILSRNHAVAVILLDFSLILLLLKPWKLTLDAAGW